MYALMVGPLLVGGNVAHAEEPAPATATADSGARKGGGKKDKKGGDDGVGPYKKKDYPIAERGRPLTLPMNMGEVIPSLGFNHAQVAGVGGDAVGIGVGFKYGLAHVVEVGVSTGVAVSPEFDWSRNLTLQGHYLAYDSKRFDVAPGVVIPLTFVDGAGVGVTIDVTSRYLIQGSPFFLRFGQGAVGMGVSPDFFLTINGNGGAGYQINKNFVATLDTSLLSLRLTPDGGVSGLWDNFNFQFGGQYTINRNADIGATLGYSNLLDVEQDYNLAVTGYGRIRF